MAKLSAQEITDIIESKGFTCSNVNEYVNMDTIMHLQCTHGHHIDASIKTVRNANFKCPYCVGDESISDKISNIVPPIKQGYRVIAIDNATNNAGLSIFDDGKLVFYHLFQFEGDAIGRILKNRKLFVDMIIKQWKPDLVVLEDIQLQHGNVTTYKTLAMLLGNILVAAREYGIHTETVLSSVWRSHFLMSNKNRTEQKQTAVKKVKDMYNITVSDDIAEAILLGKYAVDIISKQTIIKKLF